MDLLQITLTLGIGVLAIYQVLWKWTEIWYGRNKGLPPGTMGWPLLGENASYWKLGSDFIINHQLRYGDVFKTNIFGGPTIVSMDPEINKYILTHENKGFVPGYPKSMMNILGKYSNVANVTGTEHKAIRAVHMSQISLPVTKDHFFPMIDEFMQSYLKNWGGRVLDIQDKCNELVMLMVLKMITGLEESNCFTKELQQKLHDVTQASKIWSHIRAQWNFQDLPQATLEFWLSNRNTVPQEEKPRWDATCAAVWWTLWRERNARIFTNKRKPHKLAVREALELAQFWASNLGKIVRILGEMIDERRASTCRRNDILDALLNSGVSNSNMIKLSDEQIIDFIIGFVFSGYHTITGILMMAVKYVHDHPNVQEELRRENLEIRKGKLEDSMISWDDYKSMAFTRAVVLETLRMSSISGATIRKTTTDTTIKGHLIPKGWRIYVYTREINFSPHIYPEPLKFNPWRWLESNLESHQYFMMFGGGGRLCPGKELGILETSVFLHHLVTKYSWEEVGENKISSFPRTEAPNGLYFRFSEM